MRIAADEEAGLWLQLFTADLDGFDWDQGNERKMLKHGVSRDEVESLLEIDHTQRRVRVGGSDVHLTPTEFELLVCLAQQPRAVLSREQLLAEVWDWADASGTRTVDSHVKALRRKIGAERIRTVHGVGYALETPAL